MFLIGWLGSVEQLIGHFCGRKVAEFISELSAGLLLHPHAAGFLGSCSQLVCSSKANDKSGDLQKVNVCVSVCIIEDPNPH